MGKFDYTKPHRMVNGEPVLLTDAEIAARAAEDAAWAAAAPIVQAKEQLAELDAKAGAPRWARERALKAGDIDPEAAKTLQAIEDQAAPLRATIRGAAK